MPTAVLSTTKRKITSISVNILVEGSPVSCLIKEKTQTDKIMQTVENILNINVSKSKYKYAFCAYLNKNFAKRIEIIYDVISDPLAKVIALMYR